MRALLAALVLAASSGAACAKPSPFQVEPVRVSEESAMYLGLGGVILEAEYFRAAQNPFAAAPQPCRLYRRDVEGDVRLAYSCH